LNTTYDNFGFRILPSLSSDGIQGYFINGFSHIFDSAD